MNQQQKYILNLQRKSRERKREQAFVIEGRKMFEEAPADRVKMIVASESFCKSKEGAALLKGKKFDVVSDSIFETLSDTKTPQGILAVVKQQPYSFEELLGKEKASFLLILDHLQDPGNLGTIMRAAEAAGVTGILMSSDCVDIYNPKTIRSTMGALYRVPFVVSEDFTGDIERLKKAGVSTYAAHLGATISYEGADYKKPCAFMIGNEANGLSDEVAALADCKILIPMAGQVESLNAAMAATVLMFEAARQRRNQFTDKPMFTAKPEGEWLSRGGHLKQVCRFARRLSQESS